MVMVLERANKLIFLRVMVLHTYGRALLFLLIFNFLVMQNKEITLDQAIQPVVECRINFSEQRMLLNEMFASTVSNAPDNEIDNFTARRITPFYLAMCQLLENLDSIQEVHSDNILMSVA